MCGIIGFVGKKPCLKIIYEGLETLEYRGYDSSGISLQTKNKIKTVKTSGRLSQLEEFLPELPAEANKGMGHTRWATHGKPTQVNAHPHQKEGLAIVHNGIIENFKELKISMLEKGITFGTETDTEVILHLLAEEIERTNTLEDAIIKTLPQLRGAYAIGILSVDEPDAIYVVKQGSPVVLGFGENENYFASDALAFIKHTKKVMFLEDGTFARLSAEGIKIWDFLGNPIHAKPTVLDWNTTVSEKGGYRHFMLKEIHEQPNIMRKSLSTLIDLEKSSFHDELLGLNNLDLERIKNVYIIGCGTAFYAGLVGKYILEPILKRPVSVELASEFRYAAPFINENTLIIAMTQSGETADTLASVVHAKKFGSQILTICNVLYSSIPRHSDANIHMGAGPEIGVASTKAFTSMILCLYLFSLSLARKFSLLKEREISDKFEKIQQLPILIEKALLEEPHIENIAKKYLEAESFLYIGRGIHYPIALEGALKLKEISYIHAEGYAGGELKHGPIALVDKNMPIVALVPEDFYLEKMLSNVEEIRAREGKILGIGERSNKKLQDLCEDIIDCPTIDDTVLQAMVSVVPLQLFSYYVAMLKGSDVDKPRNLAKSVTVE